MDFFKVFYRNKHKAAVFEFSKENLLNGIENKQINFNNSNYNDVLRANKIGIIYQQDNLLSDFTVIENQMKTELLWNSLIFQLYKNQ